MKTKIYLSACYIFFLFSALFLFPQFSYASDNLLSVEYRNCLDSHQDNSSWAGCGYEEIKKQDQNLNAAWKRVSLTLKKWESSQFPYPDCSACSSDEPLASLLVEQRNWIKWKDSACEFWKRGGFGRETDVLTYPSCKANMIAQRAAYLNNLSQIIEDEHLNK